MIDWRMFISFKDWKGKFDIFYLNLKIKDSCDIFNFELLGNINLLMTSKQNVTYSFILVFQAGTIISHLRF